MNRIWGKNNKQKRMIESMDESDKLDFILSVEGRGNLVNQQIYLKLKATDINISGKGTIEIYS